MDKIRLATPADLQRIIAIYNQAIASNTATADTVPFTIKARRGWFDAHTPAAYPIYVCEADNQVVGYLSLSPYRDRPALARTAEISYYVDYNFHGKGVGSALMQYALADCNRVGKQVFLAIVLEWNTRSIKLLEKYGFEKWGYLPDVAEFDGRLCGQFYYGRRL